MFSQRQNLHSFTVKEELTEADKQLEGKEKIDFIKDTSNDILRFGITVLNAERKAIKEASIYDLVSCSSRVLI